MNQGRRKDQIDYSVTVGGICLLGAILILVITAIIELIIKYR
jgi:hypothetical protein